MVHRIHRCKLQNGWHTREIIKLFEKWKYEVVFVDWIKNEIEYKWNGKEDDKVDIYNISNGVGL